LTWDLTVAISVQLCRHGLRRHAIATLLGFECLFRIGDLVGLIREDVADAEDVRMNSGFKDMGLRIRKAKTGPNQFVTVRDAAIRVLVRELVATTAAGEPLFNFDARNYRGWFKHVCGELGLSSRYVPHSLRHGGATALHVAGWSLEDIMMRGRWESVKSARRYIQAGRALLLSLHVPRNIAYLGRLFASDVVLALSLTQ
jgi:integrase